MTVPVDRDPLRALAVLRYWFGDLEVLQGFGCWVASAVGEDDATAVWAVTIPYRWTAILGRASPTAPRTGREDAA
jgi:hypothetical protein